VVGAKSKVECWGANEAGQIGDGTFDGHGLPFEVDVDNVGYVDAGGGFTCVLLNGTDAGKVACWGYNGEGELGLGFTDYSDGDQVPNLTGATALWTGDGSACVRLGDGSVSCWGAGYLAQAGLAFTNLSTPTRSTALPTTGNLTIGGAGGCAFGSSDGKVLCWGDDRFGQLGDGQVDRLEPVAAKLTCAAP
jgi:alpha-tubulin suppressor-like RCC1 family protein